MTEFCSSRLTLGSLSLDDFREFLDLLCQKLAFKSLDKENSPSPRRRAAEKVTAYQEEAGVVMTRIVIRRTSTDRRPPAAA